MIVLLRRRVWIRRAAWVAVRAAQEVEFQAQLEASRVAREAAEAWSSAPEVVDLWADDEAISTAMLADASLVNRDDDLVDRDDASASSNVVIVDGVSSEYVTYSVRELCFAAPDAVFRATLQWL